MTDLVVRPLVAGEEDLFLSLTEPALTGVQSFGRDYRELTARGEYRPEWTWVALRGSRVVARVAWWGAPDDTKPMALDWLDFDDGESAAAVEILTRAGFATDYCLVLPPHWRDDPAARKAGEARIEVAERAGMRQFVERFRYTWTPADGLPERPGRLRFEADPDDERFRDALRRIAQGSLDAHHRRAMAKGGPDEVARDELEFLHWLPSPREWWRLAYTVDGELAGLTVPGRNYNSATIGLVGVVPEQRGHGYAYDLLVEATHLLVEAGAEQVTAETDATNTPMAATFARAGYPINQERVLLTTTDLVVRPLVAGEEDLFLSLTEPGLVGIQSVGRDYRELTARGEYRPEWTWVALRGDRVVARAAWWAGPDDDKPIALDWLDFDDDESGAAVEILTTAGFDAEYCLVLPPHWRDDPATRKAGEARVDVARRSGMKPFIERLRYAWTPADGLPEKPGRLRFEPEPDDDQVFDVLRRIAEGSLDAHHRRAMAEGGADAAARAEMEFLEWMPSPREWLRLAYTMDGELAGLVIPGRNYGGPTIGLVAVLPEQRGHGYAYDLLVEATHLLLAEGAEQITAETDVTNTPMAATFARAGYPITQERIYLK